MKNRVLALLVCTTMASAALAGCQKNEDKEAEIQAAEKAEAEAVGETGDETEASLEASAYTEYVSADGWKVLYNEDTFFLNDTIGNGEVLFNYQGECSGTTAVDISYIAGKMPDEVLYEKTEGIDDALITRGESRFGMDGVWAHYRNVSSENQDPDAGDIFNESYTAIEHNGGTVLIDIIVHGGEEEAVQMGISDTIAALLDTFALTDHEPQIEYAYMEGTYVYETTDEIDGEEIAIKETITLNADHTCMVSFQDDIQGDWTGTQILLADGSEYEFTVEGDNLMLGRDDMWVTYTKVK